MAGVANPRLKRWNGPALAIRGDCASFAARLAFATGRERWVAMPPTFARSRVRPYSTPLVKGPFSALPELPDVKSRRIACAVTCAVALAASLAMAALGSASRPAAAPQPRAAGLVQDGSEQPATRPATGRPAPAAQPAQNEARGGDQNGDQNGDGTAGIGAPANGGTTARQSNGGANNGAGANGTPNEEELVYLSLKDVKVEDTIPFIVEWSNKVVILKLLQVAPTRITLVADKSKRVTRREALDLLFHAFRLNGIGVVETDDLIIIDLLTQIGEIQDPGLVLGPDDNIFDMSADGVVVTKVFRIRKAKADVIGEKIQEFIPESYAKIAVDANTNQIVLQGTVGLAKRVQELIARLDEPTFVDVQTRTFTLRYADAQTIADAITTLFEASGTGSTTAGRNVRQPQPRGRQPNQGAGSTEIVNTSEQLRVVTLPQLNQITVSAEPDIMEQIRNLIVGYWDQPLETDDKSPIRIYSLRYADPIQVRDVLQVMLEGASSATRGRTGGAARGGAVTAGAGGESAADVAVANIFRFEALVDERKLMVVSRTPANFVWLDEVINELDQPTEVGAPILIPLRFANAVEVSEQLNAILAEAGSNVAIDDQATGLTRGDVGASSIVEGGARSGASGAGGAGGAGAQQSEITFPWGSGRQLEGRSPESSIIGKVRIVPIIRQNAIMVLAPPVFQLAVKEMVENLDKAGRQVLISAVICAVDLQDDFAFGLRVSPDGIVTALSDNALGGTIGFEGSRESTSGFFDMSLLNVNVNVSAVLQAINQKTNVRIIQQPRIFTSDNTEAVFFNGQEVPFIIDSQVNDLGNLTQSFSYIPVGVTLNVRPRITPKQDVALEINLTLSNTVPGETLFGGAILDRRTTETQATVKNGQTIVLSGIRVDSETKISRKVPFLGDIPLVGPLLFTSYDNGNSTQELIAFVTPIVVENPDENDENFNVRAIERLQQIVQPLEQQLKNQYEPFNPTPVTERKDPEPQQQTDTGTGFGWKQVPPDADGDSLVDPGPGAPSGNAAPSGGSGGTGGAGGGGGSGSAGGGGG